MTKAAFLQLLGEAYDVPAYYANNLDSADEILAERLEESTDEKFSLRPFVAALLSDLEEEERAAVLELVGAYFF